MHFTLTRYSYGDALQREYRSACNSTESAFNKKTFASGGIWHNNNFARDLKAPK